MEDEVIYGSWADILAVYQSWPTVNQLSGISSIRLHADAVKADYGTEGSFSLTP